MSNRVEELEKENAALRERLAMAEKKYEQWSRWASDAWDNADKVGQAYRDADDARLAAESAAQRMREALEAIVYTRNADVFTIARAAIGEKDSVQEGSDQPYIIETKTETVRKYNRDYGDERLCAYGHEYYRHFDGWDDMRAIGCKYCDCDDFCHAREGCGE